MQWSFFGQRVTVYKHKLTDIHVHVCKWTGESHLTLKKVNIKYKYIRYGTLITDYLCLLRLNERHFSTCKAQKLWVWYRVFSFLFKIHISFYSLLYSMSQMNWMNWIELNWMPKLKPEKVNHLVLITIRGIGIHPKCDFERSLVS